jgi:putative intracellular protease/amidase
MNKKIARSLIIGALCLASFGGSSAWAQSSKGKILVVLSGVDYVSVRNAAPHPTGYFLVELMGPLTALLKAGYEVVYANPNGKTPAMDVVSDDPKWFKSPQDYQNAKELLKTQIALKTPRLLSSLKEKELESFTGIFLPGGHAPMEDLYRNVELGRILRYFHQHQKTTALICHAPIALLAAQENGSWIYENYTMTVFSDNEEKQEEALNVFGGTLNFYVQDALAQAGGNLVVGLPWTSHAVQDKELITGQNPMSEEDFTQLLLRSLDSQTK